MELPPGDRGLAWGWLTERWGGFSPSGQNVTRKIGLLGVDRADEPTVGGDFWSRGAG